MRFAAIAVLSTLAAHLALAQGAVARNAGCYALARDTLRVGARGLLALDTVRLRLDTTALPRARTDYIALRRLSPGTLAGITGGTRDVYRPGWHARGDSVFITWTNGFAFLSAEAVARRDSLIGTIEYGTDAALDRLPSARFVARRVACSAR